jgi:hypothetical protein
MDTPSVMSFAFPEDLVSVEVADELEAVSISWHASSSEWATLALKSSSLKPMSWV